MAVYEPDDIVTCYFIIKKNNNDKRIKAWSEKKSLINIYMKFHNCSNFEVKKITTSLKEIRYITEENLHDEIAITNIITRDRNKKHSVPIVIQIPATDIELRFVKEESDTFYASHIDYGSLNKVIPYLKYKYQKALDILLLNSIIRRTVHNKIDKINQQIELDELMILFKSFIDDFK
jgi:REP element-mobilizing transposase RayT